MIFVRQTPFIEPRASLTEGQGYATLQVLITKSQEKPQSENGEIKEKELFSIEQEMNWLKIWKNTHNTRS